jgi:tetratricopeptide (TPR) repeat protein
MLHSRKYTYLAKIMTGCAPLFLVLLLAMPPLTNLKGQSEKILNHNQTPAPKAKKAFQAFNDMAYAKAIRKYEKLNRKGLLNSWDKGHLAIAYYKTNQYQKAAEIFASIDERQLHGELLYQYARVLQSQGKYWIADRIMTHYHAEKPNDSRGAKQLNTETFAQNMVQEKRYQIELAPFNSEQSDFSPVIQNGIMYFTSARDINPLIRRKTARDKSLYLNVFRAARQGAEFRNPQLYSTYFRTMFHDGPICFNTNGTEIFITRNAFHSLFKQEGDEGYNHLKIIYAARGLNGSWNPSVDLPFNNPAYSCGHPFLTPDGNRLYFASDKPGGNGGTDIYYVDRTSRGWGIPINAGPEINTEGDELFPFMDESGRFYFSSNGHKGLGGLDLFVAEKINTRYEVKNMGFPLNSEKDDFSIYLRPNGKSGYFASNRDDGTGDDNIYQFTITKPVTFSPMKTTATETDNFYKAVLVDRKTEQTIPDAIVGILDSKGKYVQEVTSNESGVIMLRDSLSGVITAMTAVEHYYPYEQSFSLNNRNDTLIMALRPMPAYGIYGKVTEPQNDAPVSGVNITISSPSHDTNTVKTNSNGEFRARLNPYSNFEIVLQKEGFQTIELSYSTMNKDIGYVNLNQVKFLKMQRKNEHSNK